MSSSKKSKSKSSSSSTSSSPSKIHSNGNGISKGNTRDFNYDSFSFGGTSTSSSLSSIKGGFSTLTGGFGGYHGSISSDKFIDGGQDIDPQIEFCLKRLLKKDSITKLKALEDLGKLFKTLSIDKLEACSSAWAYSFNRLALVNDRRIRENLHLCFTPFCKQISSSKAKWFTVHLKRIFTYWWLHQHDPSPEVVEASYDSFYNAFGKNTSRHWKVISYVKHSMLKEIQYILDINTTPQTLSNHIKKGQGSSGKKNKKKNKQTSEKQSNNNKKGNSSKEDLERYERVIASTLCGLATLIAKENEMDGDNVDDKKSVDNNNNKWWFDDYHDLLCNINTWRFINDRSPLLRNSAYLLCASCLSNNDIAKEILPLISSTLFRCMSETYIPNMDNLWTALLAMVQFKSCWKYGKKKSFLVRLCNLVQVDIFTSCKYLRAFLLFVPSNYLFNCGSIDDLDESGADSDRPKSKKKKKKKSKKNKNKNKNCEDDNLYPICKILKSIWIGALNISHLSKRFKSVTGIYFRLILQLLLNDNNAKCDDKQYKFDPNNEKHGVISKLCKEMIIKENVINLVCISLKELDCPPLFFELLGEEFLTKIIEYDEQLIIDYYASNKNYSINENDIKVDDETNDKHIEELINKIQIIRDKEYYNEIVVEIINSIYSSIQSEFIEPFSDLMTLISDESIINNDEQQEISDKTEDFVQDYKSGLNKISSLIVHLKPFVCIENILYQYHKNKQQEIIGENDINDNDDDDDDDENNDDEDIAYWNRKTSVKFCLYELMNEIWDFETNIELIVELSDISQESLSQRQRSLSSQHNIDSDSEMDDEQHEDDDDIKIDFAKLFVSNPNEMSFNICKSSLLLIKNITKILSIDFGKCSSKKFEMDLFLNQDIVEQIEYILSTLQTKIPMEYSSGLIEILLKMANLILNQGKNNENQMDIYIMNQSISDTTKYWKSFLRSISNYEWSLKNISVFIDNILIENTQNILNNKLLLPSFESFITEWISAFLNIHLSNNVIMSISTTIILNDNKKSMSSSSKIKRNATSPTFENKRSAFNIPSIAAESYTSLIISLQRLLGSNIFSSKCLLSILKLIIGYINAAIEISKNPNNVSYPGITKNKTHAIIRSLSRFLEQNWNKENNESKEKNESKEQTVEIDHDEKNELSRYQLLIVSKLFTLCFARDDSGDPQNIATVCEYMFKKIVRYHNDLYGKLLECIAKSLRLPWYFTTHSQNKQKNVPNYYFPSFMDQQNDKHKDKDNAIPIIINRYNPTRWRWCIQTLLLLQSTTFEHGLHLINIILDRKDLENIFSLALSDIMILSNQENNNNENNNGGTLKQLTDFGVTLSTLQRCRDVICDLSDLIGMDLVLYQPYENSHFSMLSQEQISLCQREWLCCWLLSFEEKLSWLPISTLPDPSVIEHTKQWKIEMSKYQSVQDNKLKQPTQIGFQSNKSSSNPNNQQQPSARHLFAKPRVFSSVLQFKLIIQYQNSRVSTNLNQRNPLQFKQKNLFLIPQKFIDDCILHCADNTNSKDNNISFYCHKCPMDIRSRVVGFFVNALNDRMAVFNYHHARYLDDGLRSFVAKLFTNINIDDEKKQEDHNQEDKKLNTIINNIQIMQSVFVMFPDLIPISFIRHLITLSTKCRERISNLTNESKNDNIDKEDNNIVLIQKESIIEQLRLLYELLRPIHGIALNITGEYKTPSIHDNNDNNNNNNIINIEETDNSSTSTSDLETSNDDEEANSAQDAYIRVDGKKGGTYPSSMIWGKHRELLVGTLFELFLYLNGSFEWYLQQVEKQEMEKQDDDMVSTDFKKDVFFWFSGCLTLISHSLIGMNSEGEQDVFFELDWSSLIFVSNFVMDHILHQRSEFSLCLHSYLSEFYQFLIHYSKPQSINDKQMNDNNCGDNNIIILNNIDEEFRYNMMTLWHCMAVLRQIALRSTDLSGRKNLKTKKNKSFIFESLELLTEILGNEIWRNILSSEALASPFHKLALKELEVEQLVYMSYVNTSSSSQTQNQSLDKDNMNFMVHSGIMSRSLSAISEQNEFLDTNNKTINDNDKGDDCYINITPSYQTHAILDELYHSINDLLNHPVVVSGSNLSSSSLSSSSSAHNTAAAVNTNLSSILQAWHYQLFDALGSCHHQIVASAFRILSISTRYHVLQNINSFTKKNIQEKSINKSPTKSTTPSTKSSTPTAKLTMPDIKEDQEVNDDNNNSIIDEKSENKQDDNLENDTPTMNLSDLNSDIDDDYEDSMSNSDAMSVVSTASYASVSFSMSYQYTNSSHLNRLNNNNKYRRNHNNLTSHISKKDRIKFGRIHGIINSIIPIMYLLPHNTRSFVPSHELRSWFLSWYLFMNMVEEVPLQFKLEIVQTMKHDDKYISPLGSYSLALREIIEHVYIAPSLDILMNNFVIKINDINKKQQQLQQSSVIKSSSTTTNMFEFVFDLNDFSTNYPCDDPNISANMLSRCRWLHNHTGNVFNKNIFFSNLAIRVYDRLLSYFPALCRYWATNDVKDRVTRNIVSKITSSQFSPIILKNIFNSKKLNRTLKQLRTKNYNNSTYRLDDDVILKLKCNSQTREIEALYICQEVTISMIALYPFDYPLKGVSFQWKETCGLPPKKVKNWQMLLTGMVNNQNATITEAFMLLSINIFKHYQGIDECPICYSVVHPTKKTLPKVKCATCRGKFHRYCIYKWTKTSQKSTCPLCRSLI